jgi:hypothetical protein
MNDAAPHRKVLPRLGEIGPDQFRALSDEPDHGPLQRGLRDEMAGLGLTTPKARAGGAVGGRRPLIRELAVYTVVEQSTLSAARWTSCRPKA